MLKKSEKGQTLIEAVVTLGVALVIIGSIVALANASNRRVTLARQSTQASKLAEEGMEIVRNIRDVNAADVVEVGCATATRCSWEELYGNSITTDTGHLVGPGTLGTCPGTTSWCLLDGAPTGAHIENNLLNLFSRRIEVSDDELASTNEVCAAPPIGQVALTRESIKRVTVIVSWDSPIGTQERSVVSCLSKGWQ